MILSLWSNTKIFRIKLKRDFFFLRIETSWRESPSIFIVSIQIKKKKEKKKKGRWNKNNLIYDIFELNYESISRFASFYRDRFRPHTRGHTFPSSVPLKGLKRRSVAEVKSGKIFKGSTLDKSVEGSHRVWSCGQERKRGEIDENIRNLSLKSFYSFFFF